MSNDLPDGICGEHVTNRPEALSTPPRTPDPPASDVSDGNKSDGTDYLHENSEDETGVQYWMQNKETGAHLNAVNKSLLRKMAAEHRKKYRKVVKKRARCIAKEKFAEQTDDSTSAAIQLASEGLKGIDTEFERIASYEQSSTVLVHEPKSSTLTNASDGIESKPLVKHEHGSLTSQHLSLSKPTFREPTMRLSLLRSEARLNAKKELFQECSGEDRKKNMAANNGLLTGDAAITPAPSSPYAQNDSPNHSRASPLLLAKIAIPARPQVAQKTSAAEALDAAYKQYPWMFDDGADGLRAQMQVLREKRERTEERRKMAASKEKGEW